MKITAWGNNTKFYLDCISFQKESNLIEEIYNTPYPEVAALMDFIESPSVWVGSLEKYVKVCQPNAKLRRHHGQDVIVGDYVPPAGGPWVEEELIRICDSVNSLNGEYDPYVIHQRYEKLHPFTDCNGRSGRALWAYMMYDLYGKMPKEFLRTWYFQSLRER